MSIIGFSFIDVTFKPTLIQRLKFLFCSNCNIVAEDMCELSYGTLEVNFNKKLHSGERYAKVTAPRKRKREFSRHDHQ